MNDDRDTFDRLQMAVDEAQDALSAHLQGAGTTRWGSLAASPIDDTWRDTYRILKAVRDDAEAARDVFLRRRGGNA